MPNRPSHLSRRRVHLPLWRVILSDIITAALILGLYAVFKLSQLRAVGPSHSLGLDSWGGRVAIRGY